jgi:hypothetical protein
MKRTIVIGDVHGCIVELGELLDKLALEFNDEIIFAGDLLDKGPASADVVGRVRALADEYDVTLVLGNHEEKHQRFRKHLAQGSGGEKKMRGADEMAGITAGLSKADINFLHKAVLYHQVPLHGILVTHAGVSPSIKQLPTLENLRQMSNKHRKHFYQMLRVRYVSPKGYMVSLGHEKPEDVYWADIYDGRFGKILFGHQPFYQEQPKEFPHATGIDLGACFGNRLCAAVITEAGTEYVMVDAKKQYAKKMGEE